MIYLACYDWWLHSTNIYILETDIFFSFVGFCFFMRNVYNFDFANPITIENVVAIIAP